MDYRMYTANVGANEEVVSLIKESLKQTDNITSVTPFRFIGFEGDTGTQFYLNGSTNPMEIPSCGYFITPFDGERCMPIYSLKFAQSFTGSIYYIL